MIVIKYNLFLFSSILGGTSNPERGVRHVDSFGDPDSKAFVLFTIYGV